MACDNFTFLTLNVQGLRNATNRRTLFSWLNCVKPDVVALQETHSVSEEEFVCWVNTESRDGNNLQDYSVISSPGSTRSFGVAILYRLCLSIQSFHKDSHGRLLQVCFTRSDADFMFQVLKVYGPNQQRAGSEFFTSLISLVDPSIPVIFCGDFNTVVDPFQDRLGCNPSSPWTYNWPSSLSALTERYQLIDIWRHKHSVHPLRLVGCRQIASSTPYSTVLSE